MAQNDSLHSSSSTRQAKALPDTAMALARAEMDEGFLAAKDGLKLRWRSHRPAQDGAHGEVVLVHGYGEHLGRYDHIAAQFLCRGIAVHRFEYRGHGLSGGKRTHVERFSDYLDDLDVFLAHLVARGVQQITLIGHSLGGLISARWLQTRGSDSDGDGAGGSVSGNAVERAVLCSPFLRLSLQPPLWQRGFSRLANRLFPSLAVGNGLSVAQLTSDPTIQAATAADHLYLRTTTPRWFCEVSAAQEALFQDAGRLTKPLLMLLGERDPIACPEAGRRLFGLLPGGGHQKLIAFDGMLHELFNERERAKVFEVVFDWLG
ncbi:MAG: lysophospholipase [Myxococcales bacterium]|jgi:alpha-beta hydrolase superfamily lysophospholipase|nr:lysophospholipase [Myxococcales bacterium]